MVQLRVDGSAWGRLEAGGGGEQEAAQPRTHPQHGGAGRGLQQEDGGMESHVSLLRLGGKTFIYYQW